MADSPKGTSVAGSTLALKAMTSTARTTLRTLAASAVLMRPIVTINGSITSQSEVRLGYIVPATVQTKYPIP